MSKVESPRQELTVLVGPEESTTTRTAGSECAHRHPAPFNSPRVELFLAALGWKLALYSVKHAVSARSSVVGRQDGEQRTSDRSDWPGQQHELIVEGFSSFWNGCHCRVHCLALLVLRYP